MTNKGASKPELPESEIIKRRDEGLRNLLKTPPKPHAEVVGKAGRKGRKPKKETPAK